MKTLILGTGIIGTIYGWALAGAGVDVTHYADSLQEANENYEAMLKTAGELGCNLPNLKAVGVHLKSALQ